MAEPSEPGKELECAVESVPENASLTVVEYNQNDINAAIFFLWIACLLNPNITLNLDSLNQSDRATDLSGDDGARDGHLGFGW